LDPQVACRFAHFGGYGKYGPPLVTANVRKENILAVLLGGEAPEILTFKVRRCNVIELPIDWERKLDLGAFPGRTECPDQSQQPERAGLVIEFPHTVTKFIHEHRRHEGRRVLMFPN
jgi:hypothetical protein